MYLATLLSIKKMGLKIQKEISKLIIYSDLGRFHMQSQKKL
ncbi:Uncharacterised protein [Serratia marcescens]|nr:Uncharacterised protein [Serratia marcescens]